jgi:putative ABC transport system permease protein
MLWRIAFRNLFRNRRRSLMTLLAIAVGTAGIVLFGEFIGFIRVGLKTITVRQVGHLAVFRAGYFDYGSGNPAAFGIDDYQRVIDLLANDPDIKPKLNVITPTVSLGGIAGNFALNASKTFFGTGFVPADRDRMLRWDEAHVFRRRTDRVSGLQNDDENRGIVGLGLARMLGLCQELGLKDCPPRPPAATPTPSTAEVEPPDIAALAAAERADSANPPAQGGPRLDLLAATSAGAPNVVSLTVVGAEPQGARELDENFIAMHFRLAQRLLYGRSEPKATGIVLQLHQTKDLPAVRARVEALFRQHHLDLETRDFAERRPFYQQAVDMFDTIFLFIAMIMGIIVLFTVVNTMGMSVMERTNEIGTSRALGLRRSGIRRLFVLEGALLGAMGATVGVVVAHGIALLFNAGGFTWIPPGNATEAPLRVLTSGVVPLLGGAWLGLVLMATIAAVVPANRAARLKVVDALRHV